MNASESARRGNGAFPAGLAILVLGQDVFFQDEVGPEEIVDKGFEAIAAGRGGIADEVCVNVDAQGTHKSVLGSKDGYRRAFELPRPEVELVVHLVLAALAAGLEVEYEVGGTTADLAAGYLAVLDRYQGTGGVDEVVQKNFDACVREGSSDLVSDSHIVFEKQVVVAHDPIAVVSIIELLVVLQPIAGKGVAYEVLFTDDDQLSGRAGVSLI